MDKDISSNPSLKRQYGSISQTSLESMNKNTEGKSDKKEIKKIAKVDVKKQKINNETKTVIKKNIEQKLPESKMGKWEKIQEVK